ncbi:MAG: cyclic nucleotide-binding domain-containing protein [Desulfobacterales bacterium]|nr:cyclic nucleotide-binding domain-containing protein [Desulfobacterales bacterium]
MKSNVVLKGSLSFINLGELLQLLGGSGSTGIVKITSIYANDPGIIYLVEGNPVNADCGEVKGLNAINAMFGWIDAQFEFINEPVSCPKIIKKNRMEIILDGLRLVDDGIIPKLGRAPLLQPASLMSNDDSELPVVKGPLIDYIYILDEEEFADGKEIVIQEKYGNWLWVVLQGTVEVVRLLPEGPARIVRLTDGSFIGSIGSLFEKTKIRSATVLSIGRVQLGVLDFDRIFREFTNISENLKALLKSLEKRFKEISTNCAEAILNKTQNLNLNDFKLYISSDKNNDRAYQIKRGKAFVVRKNKNQFIKLCQLDPGDIVGDVPFLNTSHEPDSAEVYVSKDFEAMEIDLNDPKEEYDDLSETLKNLIKHTASCTIVTTNRLVNTMIKGSAG